MHKLGKMKTFADLLWNSTHFVCDSGATDGASLVSGASQSWADGAVRSQDRSSSKNPTAVNKVRSWCNSSFIWGYFVVHINVTTGRGKLVECVYCLTTLVCAVMQPTFKVNAAVIFRKCTWTEHIVLRIRVILKFTRCCMHLVSCFEASWSLVLKLINWSNFERRSWKTELAPVSNGAALQSLF